jgi:hypothetical protein
MYLRYLEPHLGAEETERRRQLARPEAAGAAALADALQRYALSGVCLPTSGAGGARRTLQAAGLRRAWTGGGYEVWVRS